MKLLFPFLLLTVVTLTSPPFIAQTRERQSPGMETWVGKYPDKKFFNQPAIRIPLRRILSKSDYASITRDYNMIVPIKRVGDYLLTYSFIKYSNPEESFSLAFSLNDQAVYAVFSKAEQHRKFSTKNNQFDLPEEVLKELGLKE